MPVKVTTLIYIYFIIKYDSLTHTTLQISSFIHCTTAVHILYICKTLCDNIKQIK